MYLFNVNTSFSSTQQSKFTNFSRHSEYEHSAATTMGPPSICLCPREFLTEQFHLTFLYVSLLNGLPLLLLNIKVLTSSLRLQTPGHLCSLLKPCIYCIQLLTPLLFGVHVFICSNGDQSILSEFLSCVKCFMCTTS